MILDLFRLDGRVALVTGAAGGLGQALALGLAEAGADVSLLDRVSCAETAQRVMASGRRAYTLTHDLQNVTPEEATQIVRECVRALGGLDIVINNAGVIRRAPALAYTPAEWEETIAVDLTAAFYLAQAAARHWYAAGRGGKIINVASMLSFQGGSQVVAYAAAKSGVAGMTRALANEWAGHGINVNAIAPGYMATELTAALRADAARAEAILSRIPARRWGEPADLQGAAVFLASEAASYVHGAVLAVDGGWLAW